MTDTELGTLIGVSLAVLFLLALYVTLSANRDGGSSTGA